MYNGNIINKNEGNLPSTLSISGLMTDLAVDEKTKTKAIKAKTLHT
jgi:hypothetical protein